MRMLILKFLLMLMTMASGVVLSAANNRHQVVNSHVPDYVDPLPLRGSMGILGYIGNVTPTGARTYEIPIDCPAGYNDLMTPKISLFYNSQGPWTAWGKGWSVAGLSSIERVGKTIFYDGYADAVRGSVNDEFTLDGVRLIRSGDIVDGERTYRSFRGNIMVRETIRKGVSEDFKVCYPDGRKAIYSCPEGNEVQGIISYPINRIEDQFGNVIEYSYITRDNTQYISEIKYNSDCRICFAYELANVPDTLERYCAGRRYADHMRLTEIRCMEGSLTTSRYCVRSEIVNGRYETTAVEYHSGYMYLNPVQFFYGTGSRHMSYESFDLGISGIVKAFDTPCGHRMLAFRSSQASGRTSIVYLPDKQPYVYRSVKNPCGGYGDNLNDYSSAYDDHDMISIIADISGKGAKKFRSLSGEFRCAVIGNWDGSGDQKLVAISYRPLYGCMTNSQYDITELRFDIYDPLTLDTATVVLPGPGLIRTVGPGALAPMMFHVGDFNGDGIDEILGIIPGGIPGGDAAAHFYFFDINSRKIMSHFRVYGYTESIPGLKYSDPDKVYRASDKVIVGDYDGDGRSDILLLDNHGIHIYSTYLDRYDVTPSLLDNSDVLTREMLGDRRITACDINADGLCDLLLTPIDGSAEWTVLLSSGNGQFVPKTCRICKLDGQSQRFTVSDIDSDGYPDLMVHDGTRMTTYLGIGRQNMASFSTAFSRPGCLLAASPGLSGDAPTCLIAFDGLYFENLSYRVQQNTERLLTGVAGSHGTVEKTAYSLITDNTGIYTPGRTVAYPFVSYRQPLAVVSATEDFVNGMSQSSARYEYEDARMHTGGLGFLGFAKFKAFTPRGLMECHFDLENFGAKLLIRTASAEQMYTYSTVLGGDMILRQTPLSVTTNDLTRGIWYVTQYEHDSWGYPTKVRTKWSDGHKTSTHLKYLHSDGRNAGEYRLGVPLFTRTVTANLRDSIIEEILTDSLYRFEPVRIRHLTNGLTRTNISYEVDDDGKWTSRKEIEYDDTRGRTTLREHDCHGRVTKESYVETNCSNTYTYYPDGRLATHKDPDGVTYSYTYDDLGRIKKFDSSDGTSYTADYSWIYNALPGRWLETRKYGGTPSPRSTEYIVYDALGREVDRGVERFDNTQLHIRTEYDRFGQVSRVSAPFKGPIMGPAVTWRDEFKYDTLGRMISHTVDSVEVESYSYKGNNTVRITENGVWTERIYDSQDNLVEARDTLSSVAYDLGPDGQPEAIYHGCGTILYGYDKLRRCVSVDDPSSGIREYEYRNGRLYREIFGDTYIQYLWDKNGNLTRRIRAHGMPMFSYGDNGRLTEARSLNSKMWLSYSDGRLGRVAVTVDDSLGYSRLTQFSNGEPDIIDHYMYYGNRHVMENRIYTRGQLTEIRVGDKVIYKLDKEDSLGRPVQTTTLETSRYYTYGKRDFPASIRVTAPLPSISGPSIPSKIAIAPGIRPPSGGGTLIDFSSAFSQEYIFDPLRASLVERVDHKTQRSEIFGYDALNRLISFGSGSVTYGNEGNITFKSDFGDYHYNIDSPYAVDYVEPVDDATAVSPDQYISYTTGDRPLTITQGGWKASFKYDALDRQVGMTVTHDDTLVVERVCLNDCYEWERTPKGVVERLYLGGDFHTAPAMAIVDTAGIRYYAIIRDYLGSIVQIIGEDGKFVQNVNYDAWGNIYKGDSFSVYAPGEIPARFVNRGFTGHEHLPWFGLINMGARLYDPVSARFLSPDPLASDPGAPQAYNRYSYAMNNPLTYVDENGEMPHIVIAAIVGGTVNLIIKIVEGDVNNFGDGLKAFGVGALAGGIGAATGGLATYTIAGTSISATGALGSLWIGASTAIGELIPLNTLNHVFFGDPLMSFNDYVLNIGMGALSNGITNGLNSAIEGGNFIFGKRGPPNTATPALPANQTRGSPTSITSTEREHKIYIGYDPETKEINYVGRTIRDPTIRWAEHRRSNTPKAKLKFKVVKDHIKTLKDARYWEQYFINKHGGINELYNMRNEIPANHWKQFGLGEIGSERFYKN